MRPRALGLLIWEQPLAHRICALSWEVIWPAAQTIRDRERHAIATEERMAITDHSAAPELFVALRYLIGNQNLAWIWYV